MLERTSGAVAVLGDVLDRRPVMNGAGRAQLLAAGTDVEVALLVKGEVSPREFALKGRLALVPDRDVWIDPALDQPPERNVP